MTANDTTPNDSTTTVTKRYSVWTTPGDATKYGPNHSTWNGAKGELAYRLGSEPAFDWRIWDHSTTPPTDVTFFDPEGSAHEALRKFSRLIDPENAKGPHPMTPEPAQPTIPEAVKELIIKRHDYEDGKLNVTAKGIGWSVTYLVHERDVFIRLKEFAGYMEEQK